MIEDEYKDIEAPHDELQEAFKRYDQDGNGLLTRKEFRSVVEDIAGSDFSFQHIDTLFEEFDNDGSGTFDFFEFRTMMKYLKKSAPRERSLSLDLDDLIVEGDDTFDVIDDAVADTDMTKHIQSIVQRSRRDSATMLKSIASDLYHVRNLLCVQDMNLDPKMDMGASVALNFDHLVSGDICLQENSMDPDFEAAFSPSDMRCLALVSHNGMKKTMREFVMANKNLLKKFRLTGTNSTMTMLKEIFRNEPSGTVVFGPACASGPLGGDAELVAHMVSGRIGGILFFQDPMDSHPHRADIDCLVRQSLVYNIMLAETPLSALMLLPCLRMGLMGKGKPELIPSFFFSLQSPTVESYKSQQKNVVEKQKSMARMALLYN